MNRLLTRLVLSHLLVAAVGASATFVVVRVLAPRLYDQRMHSPGMGMGPAEPGTIRAQFASAVDQALLAGTILGALAAATFGAVAAYRIIRPLSAVRAATRDLATGRYRTQVPTPREVELGELARDINALGQVLAATEERRVVLLGEVSHEMRTPLTVIDGYVEAMVDGIVPTDPGNLGQISAEVRRLRRLSDDLSALSRSDEGLVDLRLETGDLGEVVRVAAERLRPQADDAGVALAVFAPDQPLPMVLDRDRIAQVVTNLVGNALVATPEGGQVQVACRSVRGAAEVTVTDSGIGLTTEDLDRVFERFYRVPGRDRRSGGTGVGLTIARSLVRAHGGELTLASAGPGLGVSVTARFPTGHAAAGPATDP